MFLISFTFSMAHVSKVQNCIIRQKWIEFEAQRKKQQQHLKCLILSCIFLDFISPIYISGLIKAIFKTSDLVKSVTVIQQIFEILSLYIEEEIKLPSYLPVISTIIAMVHNMSHKIDCCSFCRAAIKHVLLFCFIFVSNSLRQTKSKVAIVFFFCVGGK